MGNLTSSEVKELYKILGISSKFNKFDENSFFNSKEKDKHLAWKPLDV